MLTAKPRFPVRQILLHGWLPSPLKKLFYRLKGYQIGKGVRLAPGSVILGKHVTMDACRHGGMTELGDAEATEQEIMSASGHRSPEAARVYVKRTEKQRISAVRKRRVLRKGNA